MKRKKQTQRAEPKSDHLSLFIHCSLSTNPESRHWLDSGDMKILDRPLPSSAQMTHPSGQLESVQGVSPQPAQCSENLPKPSTEYKPAPGPRLGGGSPVWSALTAHLCRGLVLASWHRPGELCCRFWHLTSPTSHSAFTS